MEMVGIGFLMGAVVAIIAFLMGRISNERVCEREFPVHRGGSNVPVWDSSVRVRVGSDDKGITEEEMTIVLEYFRVGATEYEKRVIDAIKERV